MKAPNLLLATCLALALPFASLQAASLRMFSDINAAVENAKLSDRLILFVLLNPQTDSSATVAKMLNDNSLELQPDEFIVVTCSAGEPSHERLFQTNFKQDTSKAPIIVITDFKGTVLSSAVGENTEPEYDKIVMDALIKAGKREAPKSMVVTTGEITGTSKIFRLMKEDLGGQVVITEYRTWELVNGEKIEAALLQADGEFGIFRLESGDDVKVKFTDLIPEDIAFLEKALSN